VEAWLYATHLCLLAQLLGNDIAGHVAEVAYGLSRAYDPAELEAQPTGGSYDGRGAPPGHLAPLPESPGGAAPGEMDEGEGEESAAEAVRRRSWVEYYVSVGQFGEAEDIGWDARSPPDPRTAPAGSAEAADGTSHSIA
jgi:hypothetical protein